MRRGLGTTCSVSALALEGHAGDDGGHEDWMFKNAALAAWLVPTSACIAAADVQQDDPFVAAPDVTGTFNVTLDALSGCEGTELLAWARGALVVDGAADALTFDFGDGAVLTGTVDQSYFVELGGTFATAAGATSVLGDGVAATSPAGWRLDGTLRATPPDGSCEQRADFVAQMGTP